MLLTCIRVTNILAPKTKEKNKTKQNKKQKNKAKQKQTLNKQWNLQKDSEMKKKCPPTQKNTNMNIFLKNKENLPLSTRVQFTVFLYYHISKIHRK